MNTTNKQAMAFDRMFWDMGTMCFDALFDGLNKATTQPVSTSRDVLKERTKITGKIELMTNALDEALEEVQSLNDWKKQIQKNKKLLDANKKVVTTRWIKKWKKIPSNNKVITTCMKCPKRTCHPGCCVADKKDCCMMNEIGKCEVCGCGWELHKNCDYEWKKVPQPETHSSWDDDESAAVEHGKATEGLSRSQREMMKAEAAIEATQRRVENMIVYVHSCINRLEQIALRPSATTVGDYIDKLIEAEDQSPDRNNDKLKTLKECKKAERLLKMAENTKGKKNIRINIKDLIDAHQQ